MGAEKKYKIGVVTATRAEYGLLRQTIDRIYKDPQLELCLLVTGAHLSDSHGMTVSEIEADGYPITERIPILTDDDTDAGICISMAKAMEKFGNAFSKHRPDMLVVLGDRYELLPICSAALIFNIPITHLCGGEITEGAIDDSVRHAVTKMSNLHFAGCEEYRRRIVQMGEEPERVFNYGDVGIENILKTDFIAKEDLYKELGLKHIPTALVTFHPVTLEKGSERTQITQLIDSIDGFSKLQFVFTKANADAGGALINEMIEEYAKSHENVHVYSSLGSRRYLSLMKNCDFVLGNSSSGIVETPAFHIPTVNVGNRQKGRLRAGSVIDCECLSESIKAAIETACSKEFIEKCRNCDNPYGSGETSVHIIEEIKKYLQSSTGAAKKFYDLNTL